MIVLLATASVTALVASIDKPKMVLYKNVTPEKPLVFTESVIVNNNNKYDVKIRLEPIGDLKDMAEIKDVEFIMKPDERKEVFYDVTITKPGNYKGDILVKFSQLDANVGAALAQTLVIIVKGNGDFDALEAEEQQDQLTPESNESAEPEAEETQIIEQEAEEDGLGDPAEGSEGDKSERGPKLLTGILIILGIILAGVLVYTLIFIRGGKK